MYPLKSDLKCRERCSESIASRKGITFWNCSGIIINRPKRRYNPKRQRTKTTLSTNAYIQLAVWRNGGSNPAEKEVRNWTFVPRMNICGSRHRAKPLWRCRQAGVTCVVENDVWTRTTQKMRKKFLNKKKIYIFAGWFYYIDLFYGSNSFRT